MYKLFLCEWQKLWNKKSTLLCFLCIPLIIFFTAQYYLKTNTILKPTNPEFTSFYNFPVAAIQEQLLFSFNILVIFLIVLSVTEEYKSKQIRMILIRPINLSDIFIVKYITIIIIVFLFLITYLLCSYFIGYILFSKINKIKIFYCNNTLNANQMLLYTIKYYSISFLTLCTMSTIIFFISTISKSVVIASGTSIGILMFFIIYPTFIEIFFRFIKTPINLNLIKLKMLSITQIQFEGIARILGSKNYSSYVFTILFVYFFTFFSLCYYIYSKKDYYI
ncbi:ABC transporter permease [Tepidibacter thalassicus]|uniref:ABC-2 family transporter protein n=1 Tax=Tepidibacter thalassicus DSM 15285 TaxID=1123350 RepID=A0A1M5SE62_9FIRM|nr:ABC transporter permease [Tepidibacter thalassicus]SHH36761.1 hypothetical protein SAMN02744040_01732 [Tepidibacter thalassicus DSM 15285]